MTEQTIEVHFIHPYTSKRLVADLGPHCTGHEALEALLSAEGGEPPFLAPSGGQTYVLSLERTGKAITPNMTFLEAGVMDRDIINIAEGLIGAASLFYRKAESHELPVPTFVRQRSSH